jgi:hypothetical protein
VVAFLHCQLLHRNVPRLRVDGGREVSTCLWYHCDEGSFNIIRGVLSIKLACFCLLFCLLFCSGDVMASAQKKVSPKPKSRRLTSRKNGQIDRG